MNDEESSPQRFNDLTLLLQTADGLERARRLDELCSVGTDLLLAYGTAVKHMEPQDAAHCASRALEYFSQTNLPATDGAPPRIPVRETNQAYNLLKAKFDGEHKDFLKSGKRYAARFTPYDEQETPMAASPRGVRTELIVRERAELICKAFADGMFTQSGTLGPKGSRLEFSAEAKRRAFEDYLTNVLVEKNLTQKAWRSDRLEGGKYLSKPREGRNAGEPMQWNEFHRYFNKVACRIKANLIRAASDGRVEWDLLFPKTPRRKQ